MSLSEALPELVGEYSRFSALGPRVEALVDLQVKSFVPERSQWLVLPWRRGFYLFSEDGEGQRRGREVLAAFLGPSVVSFRSVPDEVLSQELPAMWKATGLERASYLDRLGDPEGMLQRLEDALATMRGRTLAVAEMQPSHSEILRDLRLAMLAKDDALAGYLFKKLELDGHMSAENLRFLRIELLAVFGRWSDIAALAYINAMTQARRPRAVTESLLQMLWWTEIAPHAGRAVRAVFDEVDVLGRFGSILRAIWVPTTASGRAIAMLTAVADGDTNRQQAILSEAKGEAETTQLLAISDASAEPERDPEPTLVDDRDSLQGALADRRYRDVLDLFLEEPLPEHAEAAVMAVLDAYAFAEAPLVLELVQGWVSEGAIHADRRLMRDIDELARLVSDSCDGWVDWAERLGRERWIDANAVLRERVDSWVPLEALPSVDLSAVANGILAVVGGPNSDQLRSCLDVLVRHAASASGNPSTAEFCEVVLQVLSDQDNLSEAVRNAYLDLLTSLLAAGPSISEYRNVLELTAALWERIVSPHAADWASGVLEALMDASSPDSDMRQALGAKVITAARQLYVRLSIRQQVEFEVMAPEFGMPAIEPGGRVQEDAASVWSKVDGKKVGIYSLLAHAASRLEARLTRLCTPSEVQGNADKVATAALRSLARQADYLIVDTWHAAHQATGAIDAERPKEKQILPRQRGVSGFLRALEEALDS